MDGTQIVHQSQGETLLECGHFWDQAMGRIRGADWQIRIQNPFVVQYRVKQLHSRTFLRLLWRCLIVGTTVPSFFGKGFVAVEPNRWVKGFFRKFIDNFGALMYFVHQIMISWNRLFFVCCSVVFFFLAASTHKIHGLGKEPTKVGQVLGVAPSHLVQIF